jgi:hypothetical protein
VFDGNSGVGCNGAEVRGESNIRDGVDGMSNSSIGVYGFSNSSTAVEGWSNNGAALYGYSYNATGVVSAGANGTYLFEAYDTSAANRRFAVERATGKVLADGAYTGPADFAEMMPAASGNNAYGAGDVLIIAPDGKLALSDRANATNLAGVYSAFLDDAATTEIAAHGIGSYGASSQSQRVAVALVGIVPVKVTDENGPIHPGDLLTTSSSPGHAMRARSVVINGVEIYPTGTILGKALEAWGHGDGVIQVLVTLR